MTSNEVAFLPTRKWGACDFEKGIGIKPEMEKDLKFDGPQTITAALTTRSISICLNHLIQSLLGSLNLVYRIDRKTKLENPIDFEV